MKIRIHIFILVSTLCAIAPGVHAQEAAKLPYTTGQSFVVVQGYHEAPTHIHKDDYAIDFTQDGCDAYAKQVVAAISGQAWVVQESGYNGGYGTQLLMVTDGTVVSRYAHMIPGSITVKTGDMVAQGTVIGEIGNTGLVMGTACAEHPGTHIHFAMDVKNADGSFTAKDPEPISGYTNIADGNWYLSGNTLPSQADLSQKKSLTAIAVQNTTQDAAQNTTQKSTDTSPAAPIALMNTSTPIGGTLSTPLLPPVNPAPPANPPPSGGVSSGAPPPLPSTTPPPPPIVATTTPMPIPTSTPPMPSSSAPLVLDPPEPMNGAGAIGSFNSSTYAIDLAWQAPDNISAFAASTASSSGLSYQILNLDSGGASGPTVIATTSAMNFSYSVSDSNFGHDVHLAIEAILGADFESGLATTTITIPNWLSAIQPVDDNDSEPSWYGDNWYDLGTGFSGTIRSLTLEGYIDSDSYLASQLAIEEFSDPGYTTLDHTFPILNDESFAQATAKIRMNNLKIPLQPDKYYRLTTYQDYQNRSVILKGTDATGTAMSDYFSDGIGIVRNEYAFYPYISAIINPDKLSIGPPIMSGGVTFAFDAASARVIASWPAAAHSDEPLVEPSYQVNIATSTTFDSAQWQTIGSNPSTTFNVFFSNTYSVAVRAVNDFGATSTAIVATWNFPENYVPVPEQFDHSVLVSEADGAQEITFLATTTASEIDFWLNPVRERYCCSETYLSIYKDESGTLGEEIPSGNPTVWFGEYDSGGASGYVFASPITFSPGAYWFAIRTGPDGPLNPTAISGSSNDSYGGGFWSTSPGQDAFFRIIVVPQGTGP